LSICRGRSLWFHALAMNRAPISCLLLSLLLSSTALAQKEVPTLDNPQGINHEVQLLGWSKDERRYALRIYDLPIAYEAAATEAPCKGYVNHLGKPFHGGLSFTLYEGTKRLSAWRIQDSDHCTAPEKARERLAKAKEELAKEGIDLSATGAVLLPPAKGPAPSVQKKGKKEIFTTVTELVVPHGPWARQVLEVRSSVEVEPFKTEDDPEAEFMRSSIADFTVSLREGQSTVKLGEFRTKKIEWNSGDGASFTPRFDQLFLSPSGRRLVALAAFLTQDMRLVLDPRVIVAVADISGKLPAPPLDSAAR
jgi:hypothetical protein